MIKARKIVFDSNVLDINVVIVFDGYLDVLEVKITSTYEVDLINVTNVT